jgi:hypothetical protein
MDDSCSRAEALKQDDRRDRPAALNPNYPNYRTDPRAASARRVLPGLPDLGGKVNRPGSMGDVPGRS